MQSDQRAFNEVQTRKRERPWRSRRQTALERIGFSACDLYVLQRLVRVFLFFLSYSPEKEKIASGHCFFGAARKGWNHYYYSW